MNSRIALLFLFSMTSAIAFAEYEMNSDDSSEESSPSRAEAFISARPDLSGGAGLIAYGDFLYWKAAEEGLAYGLRSINPSGFGEFGLKDPFSGVRGKPSRIHPGWESGFRLGLAYNIPHDEWDISFTWTRYNANKKNHVSEKPKELVFSYWTDLNFNPGPMSARAKWDLSFSVIDFDLSRSFYLGESFYLCPFGGFKAAWIDQELFVDYQNVSFVIVKTPHIVSKNRNNFQGYGIGIGTKAVWDIWEGLHLFGKFEGGLMLGTFKIAEFISEPHTPRSKLIDSVREVAPMLGVQGGIGWQSQMHTNRVFLNIHVAWEEQVWFDQNQLSRFIQSDNEGVVKSQRGDLTFAGWTIGAMLGF